MASRTFPKNEHLKSKKQIQALFHNGKAFSVFPLKVYYLIYSSAEVGTGRVGFSVPTRHFKKAVDRNRLKRQMRETYRLQKKELTDFLCDNHLDLAVFFVYIDKSLADYAVLHEKMSVSLARLIKLLRKQLPTDENNK